MATPSTPTTESEGAALVPAATDTPADKEPTRKKHKQLSPEEIATIERNNVDEPPKVGKEPERNSDDVEGKTWINWRTAVTNYGVVIAKPRKNEGLFPSAMDKEGHAIICNEDNAYAQGIFEILKQKYLALQQRVASGKATLAEKQTKMEHLMDIVFDEELARLAEDGWGYPFAKPVTRERAFLHKLFRGYSNNPTCNVLVRRMAYRFALLRLGETDAAGVGHYSPFGPSGTMILAARLECADQIRGGTGGETYAALYNDDRNWFVLAANLLYHHLAFVEEYPIPDGKKAPKWPAPKDTYKADAAISYELQYPGSKGEKVTHIGYISTSSTERAACRKMITHYKENEASYFAKDWFGEHVHAMAMTKEASTATGAKLSPGLVYYPKLAVKKALQSHIAQKSADTQRENRHNTPIHPKKV